jgi:hypothetical protein
MHGKPGVNRNGKRLSPYRGAEAVAAREFLENCLFEVDYGLPQASLLFLPGKMYFFAPEQTALSSGDHCE